MQKTETAIVATSVALSLALLAGPAMGDGNESAQYAQANQQTEGKSQGDETGAKKQSGQAGQAGRAGETVTIPTVVYTIIPVQLGEQTSSMKSGCWARFYDEQEYRGDMLTLLGPVDMPNMIGPFGIDWHGKISSVETGPKTNVLVYDNENYVDLVATFKAGQKVQDVSKKMGFFDEFASLKISCTK